MLFSEIYNPSSQQPQMSEEQMRQARINRWGADTTGPHDAFSEDYSDKFNTVLAPDEEEKYQAWATENHREKDVYDYDLRGAWKELQSGTMSEDERGHLGDKYKKPNHPTFSDQSIYSGQDGVAGGVWSRNAEGKDVYTPGRKLSSVEADRLRRYFLRNEPGVMLDLKDKVFEERPLPGVNMPLGVFSGLGDTWKGIPAAVLQTASSAITAFKNTGADVLSRMGRDETRAWWEGQKAVMDQAARDIRDYNKVHFEVDPETMGTASQIVYGLFKTLPKAIGYGLAGGVAGGALAFGADVGIDETNRLMDEGVDRDTAINAGLVSFGMNAIGMRLPAVLGASRGMSMAYGAAANAGTNGAEVEGIKFILEHQDYNQLAQQYDLNGVDLAVSAVMGAAFGGAFWRSPEQIRTQKYQDAARLVYEDQRTALFNKGQSQFNFQQAGVQAAINSRAVVALAKNLGIEPDKVRDFAAKIVWSEDGKSAEVPKEAFSMPVTQGKEWHMGPQTIGRENEAVNVVHMNDVPEAGRKVAIDTLAGKLSEGVKNSDSGWVLTGSRGDAKKSLPPFKFAEKNAGLYDAIVQNFEQIVSDAKLIESHTDTQHQNSDVRGIHKFAAAASYGGKNYRVQLIVRDYLPSAGGERLATHSIDAVEVEEIGTAGGEGVIAPLAPTDATSVPPGAAQSPGAGVPTAWSSADTVSLSDLLKGFVREDQRGAFDSVDDSYRAEGAAYYEPQEFNQTTGAFSYDAPSQRVQKRNADKIRNGGRLVDAYLYTLINNVEKIGKAPTEPQIDSYATEKRIREVFENNSEGFDAWVAKKTEGLFGEPKIKVGGKLVPVTLQNVVKAMTKRVAKNTQDTMTFGPGKVRAAASKKFSSVKSIQANRERVVDSATANEANKSIDAAMSDFRRRAADFYGYKDAFAAMDDAMRALADSAKGKPTTEKVRAALVKNGFKEPKGGFPSELLDSGVKILTDVQKGLTDYFEAKPQRAVGLSEFAGAVVPEGTLPEVLKVLEDAGVEVRTYAKDTVLPGGERTNNRLQAEKELSQKLQQDRGDVLFQHGRGESEIRGSFNPQTNTIKLTPNANLSTFSHEHSHWYLTNLFAHAADKNLSPEARADIDALLKAFGLKSVEEYNALPFEKIVKLQEQYAAWTERYLAEGEVPAGYLQGMFRNFARWLMDMYRDLIGEGAGDDAAKKEIGERYKAQFGEDLPEPSPDVRRVLNRMYDAEKKMASFRSNSKQVTAARVIQAQRTNNQKVTAPLQNGSAPDHFMAAIRTQQQAAQAMNSGEQVDVSQTMKNVPVNDATVRQAQNAFAKSFQMGDAGTIVVLQNRDRTGAVSVGQMNAIATAPDYTRLSVSRTTDSGAPIVSYGTVPDSQYLGNTETVADGSHKIPMTYAVVEADSVLRSNNFDGTPVPEYGTDPSRMHAIAGNGRMAGLSEAYNRGTAEQYRQDLMADAQSVGINPEVVAGMQHPVLVRIMPPEAVTTGFIERSNSSNVLEKSALETAVQDSPRIRNNVWKYQFDEDGAPTPETARQFTIDIGEPNSLGKLLTADGRPTETATNRLRAAVFYEAYRDRTLTALVADDTDKQGIKRILNAMAAFAPHVINIREASNGAVDLGPILVDVVNRIRNAKIEGTPLESIVGQGDVFGDNPAVQQLLGFIAENQNSAAAIARVLEPFAAAVENRLKSSGNGPQGGLFGEAENVSTDLADVMGIFRDTQNRLISEANAAMRESGATEGFREALPAVDVETMRNTLQALAEAQRPAEKVVESVVETVTEKPAPEAIAQAADVEAHQAHEQSVFSENSDRVQVESLSEINPDMVYEWQDDDGNTIQMTARDVLDTDAAIDAEANKDMAAMGTAAMCIYRNNGITE